MFYVNLNEIESIEYRKALNVYHYIITHNEDFRTFHKVVEPNTLIKPEVIDFSSVAKFGYRLVKLSNGYYTILMSTKNMVNIKYLIFALTLLRTSML